MAGPVGELGGLEVQGVLQLANALSSIDRRISVRMRAAILEAAEPVRVGAERNAVGNIRNILSPTAEVDWWRMRIGATPSYVYVAPKERGNRGGRKRPNFGTLLVSKALTPAADENRQLVEETVSRTVDRLNSEEGF